jgi:hypothetical protein
MIKPWSLETGEWKVNKERDKKIRVKPTFDYLLLDKYTKAGPKDRALKLARPSMRQECWEHLKQAKPEVEGKGITEERYDTRISQPSQFAHPFGHPGASSSTGFLVNQMQWCPPPMMPTYLIWDPYHRIWVNYPPMMPMTPWGWGGGHLTNQFLKDRNSQRAIELIHPLANKAWSQSMRRNLCLKARLKRLLPMMSFELVQAK